MNTLSRWYLLLKLSHKSTCIWTWLQCNALDSFKRLVWLFFLFFPTSHFKPISCNLGVNCGDSSNLKIIDLLIFPHKKERKEQ